MYELIYSLCEYFIYYIIQPHPPFFSPPKAYKVIRPFVPAHGGFYSVTISICLLGMKENRKKNFGTREKKYGGDEKKILIFSLSLVLSLV